jgi:hypothetical protein
MAWTRTVRALVLVQLACLVSCATPAQREHSDTVAAFKDAIAQSKQCYDELARNPEFAQLAVHAPLTPAPATLQQLADTATPDEAGVALLGKWYAGAQICRQQILAASRQSFQFLTSVLQQNFSATDEILVRLARRQISYGEANRELARSHSAGQGRLIAAGKEWETELRQRSEMEAIVGPLPAAAPACSETGSCYGDLSDISGLPKTTYVPGYFRSDGTYVGSFYRSP